MLQLCSTAAAHLLQTQRHKKQSGRGSPPFWLIARNHVGKTPSKIKQPTAAAKSNLDVLSNNSPYFLRNLTGDDYEMAWILVRPVVNGWHLLQGERGRATTQRMMFLQDERASIWQVSVDTFNRS
jgi:hypothetical protein